MLVECTSVAGRRRYLLRLGPVFWKLFIRLAFLPCLEVLRTLYLGQSKYNVRFFIPVF